MWFNMNWPFGPSLFRYIESYFASQEATMIMCIKNVFEKFLPHRKKDTIKTTETANFLILQMCSV